MCAVAPLWRCGKEGRGCGRERTHLREKQGACLSATFPPQDGDTPLHRAARYDHGDCVPPHVMQRRVSNHDAIMEKLLAAGANTEAKNTVRG